MINSDLEICLVRLERQKQSAYPACGFRNSMAVVVVAQLLVEQYVGQWVFLRWLLALVLSNWCYTERCGSLRGRTSKWSTRKTPCSRAQVTINKLGGLK